jgi:hypothetical protein
VRLLASDGYADHSLEMPQSFVWKLGISVSTASLGNSGVIDTLNSFDRLEATDSGWEYQPYELAGSSKRPQRRRLVPKCTNCACSVCCALGICALVCPHGQAAEQEIKSGTPLRRTAAEHREYLTRQVEEDFVRHGFRGLACAPKCSSLHLAVATASKNPTVDQSTFIPSHWDLGGAVTVVRFSRPRSTAEICDAATDSEHQCAASKEKCAQKIKVLVCALKVLPLCTQAS